MTRRRRGAACSGRRSNGSGRATIQGNRSRSRSHKTALKSWPRRGPVTVGCGIARRGPSPTSRRRCSSLCGTCAGVADPAARAAARARARRRAGAGAEAEAAAVAASGRRAHGRPAAARRRGTTGTRSVSTTTMFIIAVATHPTSPARRLRDRNPTCPRSKSRLLSRQAAARACTFPRTLQACPSQPADACHFRSD